jgi:mRNA interferase RelE/StbE
VVKLVGVEGVYRVRVGDYRVVYRIEDDELLVLKIGHRGDVYKGRG